VGEDEVGKDGTGLYAEFQTDIYIPPPVVDGHVPRNAYGNLDIYVPSMIPGGAIHVQHPLAGRAAKVVGVDYADAVTGFDFKGRQGTAVINGIVAAREYRDALFEVIKGMEEEQAEAERERRTHLALQMWKRFTTALRIRDKIGREYADDESDQDMTDATDDANDPEHDGAGAGAVSDADNEEEAPASLTAQSPLRSASLLFVPSAILIVESPHQLEKPRLEEVEHKLSSPDSLFEEAGSQGNGRGSPAEESRDEPTGGIVAEGVDDESGGFIPEDDDDQGGGFIPGETGDVQGSGFFSERDQNEPSTASPRGLKLALGGGSRTAPTPELPGGSVTLLDPLGRSDSKATPDRLVKPPAVVDDTPALGPNDTESNGSHDSLDNESLLSHDPEDEDAEPEWLVDAEER
jgi:xeroderma pigmentosum group C-complementing protein